MVKLYEVMALPSSGIGEILILQLVEMILGNVQSKVPKLASTLDSILFQLIPPSDEKLISTVPTNGVSHLI